MQIRLKCPNESFMGQPRENGTSHSVTLLHIRSCLHWTGKSEKQCTEVLTNRYCGYYAHLLVPSGKSWYSCFCLVSSTCFPCADGLKLITSVLLVLASKLPSAVISIIYQCKDKQRKNQPVCSKFDSLIVIQHIIVVRSKSLKIPNAVENFPCKINTLHITGKPPVGKCTTCLRTKPWWRP